MPITQPTLTRSLSIVALLCASGCLELPIDGDNVPGDGDTLLGGDGDPGADGDSGDSGDSGDGGDVTGGDGTGGDSEPIDSVPTNPVPFTPGEQLELNSPLTNYYIVVTHAYDVTHQTPIQLFIYLHGCGGASISDVWAAGGADTPWMGMAPGGAEDGTCWEELGGPSEDKGVADAIIMAALADLKTHFNIDPKRVHIGGYSSGGDMSYWTGLHHAESFAGILSYNSIPAYITADVAPLIAAAAWKINIVHLAHTQDYVYPIADVHTEFTALENAGFPVIFIERPGLHYDDNTTDERNSLVYPHLNDGFQAP